MKILYSDTQLKHAASGEFNRGRIVPPYENTRRVEYILDAVRSSGLGPVLAPRNFGLDPVLRVHDADYLDFLRNANREWREAGREGDALPMAWSGRSMRIDRIPDSLDGRLGHYAFDIGTPIAEGTWEAAAAAADCALSAAACIADGEHAAFALCRPPGHHAARDCYGGYCYINNAAVAAQYLRDRGMGSVALLDVDYHHGNGSQAIFYDRADVFYASIHGDPATEYPYFLGYADETGAGEGEGANLNLPLPAGTAWDSWSRALETACAAIVQRAPEALVVSLGVDTGEDDPISRFRLVGSDFPKIGACIARLGLPTVFVMEGGYAIEPIGINVVSVLQGFERGANA